MSRIQVADFEAKSGWTQGVSAPVRSRWYCERLEEGQILYFPKTPFPLDDADQEFLLQQNPDESSIHKNISYRPNQDLLRGYTAANGAEGETMHRIMRAFSTKATEFLKQFLAPYSADWSLDFASFRPQEEQGRDLPLHKRNDLLHVDAFPSRPTNGGRILRVFTNVNPVQPRVWLTSEPFAALAKQYAIDAGLPKIAAHASSPSRAFRRQLKSLKRAVGLRSPDYSPYDEFMLGFHDYMKENRDYQANCPKSRWEFPPQSSWLVFTDTVPHAVLSGRYALEQTFIIPHHALLAPQKSPMRILEGLCGRGLLN
jgi:hypothetical protein